MSPEQIECREVNARSDIFGLGAVFYEMLTGKRAFEEKSQASVIAAILRADPAPLFTLQPLIPSALDRLVRTHLINACLEATPSAIVSVDK